MALVKFALQVDADAFLAAHYQLALELDGTVFMADYGIEKREDDWKCGRCRASNYVFREACHQCRALRSTLALEADLDKSVAPEVANGLQDISTYPSTFVLFIGLADDISTAKEAHISNYSVGLGSAYIGEMPTDATACVCSSSCSKYPRLSTSKVCFRGDQEHP